MTGGATPSGWYPDPAKRHDQRFWDGSKWTEHVKDGDAPATDPPVQDTPMRAAPPSRSMSPAEAQHLRNTGTMWGATRAAWRGFRRWPGGLQIAAVIAVLAVIGIALGSDSSTDNGGESDSPPVSQGQSVPKPSPAPEPAVSEPVVFHATTQQVTELILDKIGPDAPRHVGCNRITCVVEFKAKEIFSRPERETLDQERPIWKKLFEDPKLKSAKLVDFNNATTVGGKSAVVRAHSITCDREAADQIDWDNVTTDGLKVLCDFRTFLR